MAATILIHAGIFIAPTIAVLIVVTAPRLAGSRTRPVEGIATDLRRVRRSLLELGPDASVFHRRDTYAAYDELLGQACEALAISHQLGSVDGMDLEIERLRLEEELRVAGLVITKGS